ncbi:hypothetical protein [Rhizobium mongolense]|uniref:Uncharacterized protein n=2 Tax=Rhizobium mongolense TaxID=57676 RepID=A0ABR6IWW5_9HYPH|nr:hypothetical protein [Rhizobium mongolense]MBB4232270.1 hypothetical protein [Rhizobium mongolense]TVZ63018.1 hypothetical protein BCL32_3127 [Rhizobium mongolense USDA 1844]
MDEGVAAVRLQFPIRAKAIEELASRDDVFCEICRDFAEAQMELAKWRASEDPNREERCAEYQELVAGLGKEIEDALDSATVLPLRPPSAQPPR